jgi:hypothetical protein
LKNKAMIGYASVIVKRKQLRGMLWQAMHKF